MLIIVNSYLWLASWFGDSMPYKYLTESIKNFIDQKTLIELMKKNGFENCSYRNLSGGVAAIHSGWKI